MGRGEWLLLDFGAQVDGYCADLTRTVVVGARADERQRAMYELVRCAQGRALEHLRPGMTGREGDALARDVIAGRGFGDAFGHSLGHGLGLEVHEAPRLAPTSDAPVPAGAVVTVEPGVYFPGWGGVRLEDDLYLGADGPELLSERAHRARGAGVTRRLRSPMPSSSHPAFGPPSPLRSETGTMTPANRGGSRDPDRSPRTPQG